MATLSRSGGYKSLRWLLALGCVVSALSVNPATAAVLEIPLQAPLATLVPVPGKFPTGPVEVLTTLEIPPNAPADLGVGAYVRDYHGRWWQRLAPGILAPGIHNLRLTLGASEAIDGPGAGWTPATAATASQGGLFFWSASASTAVLRLTDLRARAVTPVHKAPLASERASERAGEKNSAQLPRLSELQVDYSQLACGSRWSLQVQPQPFPTNPYAAAEFSLTLIVQRPDGSEERLQGFYQQPMRNRDGGDTEFLEPHGRAHFAVRYRPRIPGIHHLRLEASWSGKNSVRSALPDLVVSGTAVDPYVRCDLKDPRFFSVNGAFYWPIGPNLRSVTDPRSGENLGTVPTALRGSLAYDAYFARLSASGVNAVEIWLSAWNLALEWRREWPGYFGLGRYHEGHAWQLDHILDSAWKHGVRVNLAVNNHGQGSGWVDSEWRNSPFNRTNGGPLRSPEELLTSTIARDHQEQVRQYLTARYADHPAILAWKLWTELDFVGEHVRQTQVEPLLAEWHENAALRWKANDPYDHLVTTHWSSNWTRVHPTVAALPGIDFLCFNAYHDPVSEGGTVLAQLFAQSVSKRALGQYRKPLLCTEFGGQFNGCSQAQMIAEHASGPWCGMVCGLSGTPMLWWYEWIDQGERTAPYTAISAFMRGEDLRDPRSEYVALTTTELSVWGRGWSRPGRLLGYLLDLRWQADGSAQPAHDDSPITIGSDIPAGELTLSWWNADTGTLLAEQFISHPGGTLTLIPPAWRNHLAFKLARR